MVREAIAKKKSQSYGHFLLGPRQAGKSLKEAEKREPSPDSQHVWLHNTITRVAAQYYYTFDTFEVLKE